VVRVAGTLGLAFGILAGCSDPKLEHREVPPRRTPIKVLGKLVGHDSLRLSMATSLATCEVVLIGSTWGTIFYLTTNGTHWSGRIPGARRGGKVEVGVEGGLVFHSRYPPWAGYVESVGAPFQELPLPEHPWLRYPSVGPMALLRNDLLAISVLGDPRQTARDPSDRAYRPMIQLLNTQSSLFDTLDSLRLGGRSSGSSVRAHLAIGGSGDTIRAFRLHDAELKTYVRQEGGSWVKRPDVELPKYFESPTVELSTYSPEWIDENGDITSISYLPQSSVAAFSPHGSLYVLRNYSGRWVEFSVPNTSLSGAWESTDRGLEVYATNGELLGAFHVPEEMTDSWITVGMDGRIFTSAEEGSVLILENPFHQDNACPNLPENMADGLADHPPPADSIVLSQGGVTR
jgi:hypothetical protein